MTAKKQQNKCLHLYAEHQCIRMKDWGYMQMKTHPAPIQNTERHSSPCPNWLRWWGLPLKLRLLYTHADLVKRWTWVTSVALFPWIYMNYQQKAKGLCVFPFCLHLSVLKCDSQWLYLLSGKISSSKWLAATLTVGVMFMVRSCKTTRHMKGKWNSVRRLYCNIWHIRNVFQPVIWNSVHWIKQNKTKQGLL